MNNKYLSLLGSSALLLASGSAFALPFSTTTTTTYTPNSVTTGVDSGYGGLKWTFGSWVPEVVAGYRHAEVNSSGATQGGDLSLAFKIHPTLPLDSMIEVGQLRLKYFNGLDYLQGEAGAGYDFSKKGFFAGIGAQGPYSNAGVDYNFSPSSVGSTFSPYLMFNSLGIYSRQHGMSVTTTRTNIPIT